MSFNAGASRKQLEASDPAATVWVNANAGSGKTHVLVDRVIRLMLGGTDPSRIMCLTFTKAAAAEMSNRLFERLSTWIVIDDDKLSGLLAKLGVIAPETATLERARQLFTRALETPGGLKIQTIHAFCERLLQLFPIEAGIVPHFTTLEEREAKETLQLARDAVLVHAQADETSDFGIALGDIASRLQADAFDSLLGTLLSKRASLQGAFDAVNGLKHAERVLRHQLGFAVGTSAESIRATCTIDAERYRELASALETGTKIEIERADEIRTILQVGGTTLFGFGNILLTKEGDPRAKIVNKSTVQRLPWAEDFIKAEQSRLREALGRLGDLDCIAATLSALRLASAIVAEYEAMKRRQGSYDFDDLIIKTGELLQERPDAAWVLYKLDGGIEHLLVDEAQDTSPAQWDIIRALTDEFFAGEGRHGRKPRSVFIVGDRKQSIYSFQGADPDVFEAVYDSYKQRVPDAGREFRPVDLTVSFRSAPQILDAVDCVFRRHSPARAGLDGRIERDWAHESNRRNDMGTVEVWDLIVPLEAPPQEPWDVPVDREPAHAPARRLASLLAKTIKSWIGRRYLEAKKRVVEPGDILILVRRRNTFFDAMIRALWTEGVPVAGADRLKLGQNIAVLDLMAMAQFCIMPEDDHALACVLKSPLLPQPLSEDELLFVAAGREGTLWQSLRQRTEPVCSAAADELASRIAAAHGARPFEFFSSLLQTSRLRFLGRLGREANDAIDALLDLALGYEQANGTSLAGFVNWFAGYDVDIKRDMEKGSGEVRIMTVHGAKGLEAPIVILPDTTSAADAKPASLIFLPVDNSNARVPLWLVPKNFNSDRIRGLMDGEKDNQTAEHRRLLYVAMTRAQDELYICGYQNSSKTPDHCWHNTVREQLEKHPDARRMEEPPGYRIGAPPSFGTLDGSGAPEPVSLPAWVNRPVGPMTPRSPGSKPPLPQRNPVHVAQGILIHRILQQLPDQPLAEWPAFIDQKIAQGGGAPGLAAEIRALAALPVMTELLSPAGISEVPLMVDTAAGGTGRRRIDRLVPGKDGILVADYKTDREVPANIEACNPEYLAQMAAYRGALRRTHPGMQLRLVLVWTAAPRIMEIPDSILDGMTENHG